MGQTQHKDRDHQQRLKLHARRAEVGPSEAPDDRPDPPFSLRSVTVAEFVSTQRELITVTHTATLGYTRALLHKKHIQSVPVVNSFGAYLGVVSLVDLTDYLLWYETEYAGEKDGAFDVPISRIIGLYSASEALKVTTTDTLRDLVKLMKKARAHRLMVEDHEGQVVAVITQMGLLQVLHDNLDDLFEQPDASLDTLGLARKPIVQCRKDESTLVALTRLRDANITGLAVVDIDGKLIGELGLAEVRAMDEEGTRGLKDGLVCDLLPDRAVHTCSSTDSLRHVLTMLHMQHHYRVFVVDGDFCPVGVVTLTDCLLQISKR